jgi:ABC-2 type transport system ATP-binding protein
MLLTTELCPRLMVIDHGRLLFDGPLDKLKRRLWRESTVKFDLKDSEQAQRLEALTIRGVRTDKLSELSYRLSFLREEVSTAEVIRRVVTTVEVLDIMIEEQSIEEVVKRIYTGEVRLEAPAE